MATGRDTWADTPAPPLPVGQATAPLREALFADPEVRTFAVIDGAAQPDLLGLLFDAKADYACLIAGKLAPEVASVAPYIVALGPESAFLGAVDAGWGRSEGIFVRTRADLAQTRRHLRTLLLTQLPDGRSVHFRFYDPRVLRTVVPLLEGEQKAQFFGAAVAEYLCENAAGGLARFPAA
jgi:hypothetical protein